MYTIGQVSEMFDIPVSTLRYYDKEGLFPNLERAGNIRRFGEDGLELLRVIECLKRRALRLKTSGVSSTWSKRVHPPMPSENSFSRYAKPGPSKR